MPKQRNSAGGYPTSYLIGWLNEIRDKAPVSKIDGGTKEKQQETTLAAGNHAPAKRKQRSALLPDRYLTNDFFACDLVDYAFKDDGASMEVPIYSLQTKPDLSVFFWESNDKTRSVSITPSVKGRVTQFDKDILIYITSQLTEALNRNRPDAKNRTIQFTVGNYLKATNKSKGGYEYDRFTLAMERLRGTTITTNIKTGNVRIKEGFGLIERWKIVERSPVNDKMVAVEVVLSEWLFNAIKAREILTINPDYFRLRKPLERRIYELARKHVGKKPKWKIGIALLFEKTGTKANIREFRRMMKKIVDQNIIPDYKIEIDEEKDMVYFSIRPDSKLAKNAILSPQIPISQGVSG
jgi:hypothetical protein